MRITSILSMAMVAFSLFGATQGHAQSKDRERTLRPLHPSHRGNESSQPVSQVTVGAPEYGGNGCPQGSMRAVFAPDNLSFSLLFDQFVAEVSDTSQGKRDVISCEALIPLQIPSGVQMKITRVDLRGFAALPVKARGELHSLFNFRGRGGDGTRMNLRYNFEGPLMEDYLLSSDVIAAGETETSPCGGSFNLRVLNQLRVQNPRKAEKASITLDSVDGSTEAVYFVSWQQCNQSNARWTNFK